MVKAFDISGFVVKETFDIALTSVPEIPWYLPLKGDYLVRSGEKGIFTPM